MNSSQLKKQWLFFAVLGLFLIGFGLSLMGEALMLKQTAESWTDWFWIGTLSLIIVNSGIAFFGKAVTLRVRLDLLKDK